MAASLIRTPLQVTPSTLTEEQLLALTRTYDTAGKPVWVHDAAARCLYQNPASRRGTINGRLAVFEIFDGHGRPVARLTTEIE